MSAVEKSDVQIEREKQAVASMVNAKTNMAVTLDRVGTLEAHMRRVFNVLGTLKRHVGEEALIRFHDGHSQQIDTTRNYIENEMAKIAKVLP